MLGFGTRAEIDKECEGVGHLFTLICVLKAIISGYLSTFWGKYAIFTEKNLEEVEKVRKFAA